MCVCVCAHACVRGVYRNPPVTSPLCDIYLGGDIQEGIGGERPVSRTAVTRGRAGAVQGGGGGRRREKDVLRGDVTRAQWGGAASPGV